MCRLAAGRDEPLLPPDNPAAGATPGARLPALRDGLVVPRLDGAVVLAVRDERVVDVDDAARHAAPEVVGAPAPLDRAPERRARPPAEGALELARADHLSDEVGLRRRRLLVGKAGGEADAEEVALEGGQQLAEVRVDLLVAEKAAGHGVVLVLGVLLKLLKLPQ